MTTKKKLAPRKKRYVAPKLVNFGDVRALTQAGSTGALESPGNPGSCTMAASKKC